MTTPSVGVERRIGQRFAFNLPVSLREVSTASKGLGFTQDLSSRGVFLFTNMPLSEGAEVELTLSMPSEITLGENMRVCCSGRVLRVTRTNGSVLNTSEPVEAKTKLGVAVCFREYEYLPDAEDGSTDFRRVSALHHALDTEPSGIPLPVNPRAAH
jgi:PilZ domain